MFVSTTNKKVRVCDICGARRPKTRLKLREGFWECDKHWGERTVQAKQRWQADDRGYIVPPTPDLRGPATTPIRKNEEGTAAAFLTTQPVSATQLGVPPYRYFNVTNGDGAAITTSLGITAADVLTTAETARALYGRIVEGTRPKHMIDRDKIKLAEMADWLLLHQFGPAGGSGEGVTYTMPASLSANSFYGAFVNPRDTEITAITVRTECVAAGIIALARAYQILGTASYLAGAQRAMLCLRRLQCGSMLTSYPTASNSAGTGRLYTGMFTHAAIWRFNWGGGGGGPS